MILDYPDHTLLFPKKGGNSDAVSVQTDTVQVSSFFFFRLYITQLSLAVLYRIADIHPEYDSWRSSVRSRSHPVL